MKGLEAARKGMVKADIDYMGDPKYYLKKFKLASAEDEREGRGHGVVFKGKRKNIQEMLVHHWRSAGLTKAQAVEDAEELYPRAMKGYVESKPLKKALTSLGVGAANRRMYEGLVRHREMSKEEAVALARKNQRYLETGK